jgi:hypothetical protein
MVVSIPTLIFPQSSFLFLKRVSLSRRCWAGSSCSFALFRFPRPAGRNGMALKLLHPEENAKSMIASRELMFSAVTVVLIETEISLSKSLSIVLQAAENAPIRPRNLS